MFPFWTTSFTLVLISVGVWRYSKRKKNLETQKVRIDFFQKKLEQVRSANQSFSKYINFETGYFTNHQLSSWISENTTLFKDIQHKPFQKINLSEENINYLLAFVDYFENGESIRKDYNEKFTEFEIENYKEFFNYIENKKLDHQQRLSIVKDEDCQLVIAGAGSGKTTTIVGKVHYIISRYHVNPKDILLISFTKKSASDLSKRISIPGISPNTFHKLGLDIITDFDGKKPSIFNEKEFLIFIKNTFKEELQKTDYLNNVVDYFLNHLKVEKTQFDFTSHIEYIQYLKDQNFKSYKIKKLLLNGKVTQLREVTKSIEECKIADFLYFNGLEYFYEYPYEYQTSDKSYTQYKPDFKITQGNIVVYVEHFGIDRMGNIPSFFAEENQTYEQAKLKYNQKIKWARELHKEMGTMFIETYSYEMHEGLLFDKLTRELINCGVVFNPKSPVQIMNIIEEVAEDEINSFTSLLSTFITLLKSNNYTIENVLFKNNNTTDNQTKVRNKKFIDIVNPIYKKYQDHLFKKQEIDFSDMINRATDLIKSKNYQKNYKYIIVDEFQDTSIGRYKLIKALRDNNFGSKVFCVGDDWQSIYRFSGSDISLLNRFEEYFGFTVRSKIETTYRFHPPLINASGDFIKKNPFQITKTLNSISLEKTTDYYFKYYSTNPLDSLEEIFEELIEIEPNISNKEIFLLGRYSFDLERLVNDDGLIGQQKTKYTKGNLSIDFMKEKVYYKKRIESGHEIKLESQFLTAHRSKGLESEIVILVNCNSGKFGFPSEISDDPVLMLLLAGFDNYENAEERRLFYVAMTRAKEKLYFISNSNYKSKFISELEMDLNINKTENKCPRCKTSELVMRTSGQAINGGLYEFYGCSNYLYGCNYTLTKWT